MTISFIVSVIVLRLREFAAATSINFLLWERKKKKKWETPGSELIPPKRTRGPVI